MTSVDAVGTGVGEEGETGAGAAPPAGCGAEPSGGTVGGATGATGAATGGVIPSPSRAACSQAWTSPGRRRTSEYGSEDERSAYTRMLSQSAARRQPERRHET